MFLVLFVWMVSYVQSRIVLWNIFLYFEAWIIISQSEITYGKSLETVNTTNTAVKVETPRACTSLQKWREYLKETAKGSPLNSK